jgi:hypothetical protein
LFQPQNIISCTIDFLLLLHTILALSSGRAWVQLFWIVPGLFRAVLYEIAVETTVLQPYMHVKVLTLITNFFCLVQVTRISSTWYVMQKEGEASFAAAKHWLSSCIQRSFWWKGLTLLLASACKWIIGCSAQALHLLSL